ncbi:hypothetical protein ACFP1H_07780 [Secundilactobacillus hailunensis]|uniref:Uncharacterized protein n=1 Tax=Secundilactobacillus hailunensis TaxID=2559923 RepID=A0ABW1T9Q2_9LACO|nr:hypothetical protein [Secundilactobacillus hailunensis]
MKLFQNYSPSELKGFLEEVFKMLNREVSITHEAGDADSLSLTNITIGMPDSDALHFFIRCNENTKLTGEAIISEVAKIMASYLNTPINDPFEMKVMYSANLKFVYDPTIDANIDHPAVHIPLVSVVGDIVDQKDAKYLKQEAERIRQFVNANNQL